MIVGADGTVAYESPAVERVLGYKPGTRIGRTAFELVHPDDVPWVERCSRDVVATPDAEAIRRVPRPPRRRLVALVEAVAKNLLDDRRSRASSSTTATSPSAARSRSSSATRRSTTR